MPFSGGVAPGYSLAPLRGPDIAGRFRALGWSSLTSPLRCGLKEFNEFREVLKQFLASCHA
jgi:hypothetical protein